MASFLPFASVIRTPTAAQCTSPDKNDTRTRWSFAKCCICSINRLRSFCRLKHPYQNIEDVVRRKYLMRFGCPVIILPDEILEHVPISEQAWRLTRSSRSSAWALNLLRKPLRPRLPVLPRITKGLNLDSNAVSKNTMRGYAIGTPILCIGKDIWA